MNVTTNLSEIESLCNQIMNSPYLRKQTPTELKQLQAVLEKVNLLVKDAVPPLIAEVKHLRNQNRKLNAELEALGANKQLWQVPLTS